MAQLRNILLTASVFAPTGVAALATLQSPAPMPVQTVIQVPATGAGEMSTAPQPAGDVPPLPPVVSDKDPAACIARFSPFAVPRMQGDGPPEQLVCHRGYMVGFDGATHDPDWVMERLAPSDLQGQAKRSNNFAQEPLLKGADANNADYARSGFDRGHQAPAGDAKFDQKIMDQSFAFSNMAPQVGIGFNRGAWKYLEETVRAAILCGNHDDVVVVTGPIYANGRAGATIGADKVAVPASFYKILYDVGSQRAVGFVLPNAKIGSRIADLQAYVKPIADIETETGLVFFANLTNRQQTELKLQPGAAWGHGSTCTGDGGD